MSRLRGCEYTPPLTEPEALRLRGLPPSWEQAVEESAIDGLQRRARAVARSLAKQGRRREADELLRRVSLLERTDELHRHASDVETLAGLYRALAALAPHGGEPCVEDSPVWAQTGSLEGADASWGHHGPAFRETAALRNRAFRWLLSAIARYRVE